MTKHTVYFTVTTVYQTMPPSAAVLPLLSFFCWDFLIFKSSFIMFMLAVTAGAGGGTPCDLTSDKLYNYFMVK